MPVNHFWACGRGLFGSFLLPFYFTTKSKYMKQMSSGNYTGYGVPPTQIEGSGVFMSDDIEEIKKQWFGAMEIFDTPDMTIDKLKAEFPETVGAVQGTLLKALRTKYKTVWKEGEFFTDQTEQTQKPS